MAIHIEVGINGELVACQVQGLNAFDRQRGEAVVGKGEISRIDMTLQPPVASRPYLYFSPAN